MTLKALEIFLFSQILQKNNLPNYEYKRTNYIFGEEAFVFSILPWIIESDAVFVSAARPPFVGP